MSNNTQYTAQRLVGNRVTDLGTRSRKASAENIAIADRDEKGAAVQVVTSAGTVVFSLAAKGLRAKPWTRTESVDDAPVIAGFTPAYARKRIGAVVYRANDKSGWLVVETATGNQTVVKTTAEAREVTNELAKKRLEAKASSKLVAA